MTLASTFFSDFVTDLASDPLTAALIPASGGYTVPTQDPAPVVVVGTSITATGRGDILAGTDGAEDRKSVV